MGWKICCSYSRIKNILITPTTQGHEDIEMKIGNTILVTGGYGFIGSCFVLRQIAKGNKVINVDKLTYAANKENLKNIEKSELYNFIEADIANQNKIKEIFNNNQIDYVVNFAAESHVDNSIESPGEFIQTNIVGTFNLLQNALNYWQNSNNENFRFLHVSTDEVFGSLNLEDEKFNEKTRYNPNSPYSASKASSDHLVRAWGETYKLPIIITNCSNNYGPRQHNEKLIPKIVECCLSEKEIPIYGNGKNIRDWIFVEDHCNGIELALTEGKLGETYCLGGDSERTNNDIVNTICSYMDKIKPRKNGDSYKDLITYVDDRKGHDFRYAIDNSKSKKELGFKLNGSFEEHILETIKFYL